MEKLIIEATNQTPEVIFDGENGAFFIAGKSYPENVNEFYKDIYDYIELYKQKPCHKTTIDFKWLYYNTATTKNIIKIILLLKDCSPEFEINWICKKHFDLIIEKGEEIKEVLNVNLNIIQN